MKHLSNVIKLFGQKPPAKSEVKKLVEAYMLMKYSGEANTRIQQRFYDKYYGLLSKMGEKYPYVDMSSDAFLNQIEQRADDMWGSRVNKGPGVDW